MKLPWRRTKSDESGLPQEVQDYYQAEKRERVGVASLLAVGTLIATIAVVAGIFFGGRWVWRHVIHKKSNVTTATVQAPDDSSSSSTSKSSSSSSTSSPSSTQNNSSTPANTSVSTGAPGSTAGSTIPNTGPSNILPLVLGAVAIGIIAAEWYQRRAITE